jgi:uncharacterized protein with HEPN domain
MYNQFQRFLAIILLFSILLQSCTSNEKLNYSPVKSSSEEGPTKSKLKGGTKAKQDQLTSVSVPTANTPQIVTPTPISTPPPQLPQNHKAATKAHNQSAITQQKQETSLEALLTKRTLDNSVFTASKGERIRFKQQGKAWQAAVSEQEGALNRHRVLPVKLAPGYSAEKLAQRDPLWQKLHITVERDAHGKGIVYVGKQGIKGGMEHKWDSPPSEEQNINELLKKDAAWKEAFKDFINAAPEEREEKYQSFPRLLNELQAYLKDHPEFLDEFITNGEIARDIAHLQASLGNWKFNPYTGKLMMDKAHYEKLKSLVKKLSEHTAQKSNSLNAELVEFINHLFMYHNNPLNHTHPGKFFKEWFGEEKTCSAKDFHQTISAILDAQEDNIFIQLCPFLNDIFTLNSAINEAQEFNTIYDELQQTGGLATEEERQKALQYKQNNTLNKLSEQELNEALQVIDRVVKTQRLNVLAPKVKDIEKTIADAEKSLATLLADYELMQKIQPLVAVQGLASAIAGTLNNNIVIPTGKALLIMIEKDKAYDDPKYLLQLFGEAVKKINYGYRISKTAPYNTVDWKVLEILPQLVASDAYFDKLQEQWQTIQPEFSDVAAIIGNIIECEKGKYDPNLLNPVATPTLSSITTEFKDEENLGVMLRYLEGVTDLPEGKPQLANLSILRTLVVLGEAVKNLSETTKANIPMCEELEDIRDKIVHPNLGSSLMTKVEELIHGAVLQDLAADLNNLGPHLEAALQKTPHVNSASAEIYQAIQNLEKKLLEKEKKYKLSKQERDELVKSLEAVDPDVITAHKNNLRQILGGKEAVVAIEDLVNALPPTVKDKNAEKLFTKLQQGVSIQKKEKDSLLDKFDLCKKLLKNKVNEQGKEFSKKDIEKSLKLLNLNVDNKWQQAMAELDYAGKKDEDQKKGDDTGIFQIQELTINVHFVKAKLKELELMTSSLTGNFLDLESFQNDKHLMRACEYLLALVSESIWDIINNLKVIRDPLDVQLWGIFLKHRVDEWWASLKDFTEKRNAIAHLQEYNSFSRPHTFFITSQEGKQAIAIEPPTSTTRASKLHSFIEHLVHGKSYEFGAIMTEEDSLEPEPVRGISLKGILDQVENLAAVLPGY